MSSHAFSFAAPILLASWGWVATAVGQPVDIPIPNGSFESPSTAYVDINVDAWEKTAQPASYDSSGGFLWSQLAGLFLNTAAGQPDHIDNLDGNQGMWLFAVPGIGVFQDYDSVDWSHSAPTHAFDATYAPGAAYRFTIALGSGGGGMMPGATCELRFYFRDASSNQVTVAAATVTNATILTNPITSLTDYRVSTPVVLPGDPWAGRHIGIGLFSTVSTNLEGGYWDVDHARLTVYPPPAFSVALSRDGSGTRLAWPSFPGYGYQPQVSSNLREWDNYGASSPGTGEPLEAALSGPAASQAFFRVVATPALDP